jgi:hypothetical protein
MTKAEGRYLKMSVEEWERSWIRGIKGKKGKEKHKKTKMEKVKINWRWENNSN